MTTGHPRALSSKITADSYFVVQGCWLGRDRSACPLSASHNFCHVSDVRLLTDPTQRFTRISCIRVLLARESVAVSAYKAHSEDTGNNGRTAAQAKDDTQCIAILGFR